MNAQQQTPPRVLPDDSHRGFSAWSLAITLTVGAALGCAGAIVYQQRALPLESRQVVINNPAVIAAPASSPVPVAIPAKDEMTKEEKPVAATTGCVPTVPETIAPGALGRIPEMTTEEEDKLVLELRERFKAVVRPPRYWPDPRVFDKVSTDTLKKFGRMSFSVFWDWRIANPNAAAKIPAVVQEVFDAQRESLIDDNECRICTGRFPRPSCARYSTPGALSEVCRAGSMSLREEVEQEVWPLRKVLEARLKNAR